MNGRTQYQRPIRNGPPYPLEKSSESDNIVLVAISSGEVSREINKDKQRRHTLSEHSPGRSFLNGDTDYAQELLDEHCGKGIPLFDRNGNWTRKEKFSNSSAIGYHVDLDGKETKTTNGMIIYSKTGTHIYPRKEEKDDNDK